MPGIYKSIGKMTPYGKAAGARAMAPGGMKSGLRGSASSRLQARDSAYMQAGKRTVMGGLAAGSLGSISMYKNKDGSRGGYRSPSTRTATGSGRYA